MDIKFSNVLGFITFFVMGFGLSFPTTTEDGFATKIFITFVLFICGLGFAYEGGEK